MLHQESEQRKSNSPFFLLHSLLIWKKCFWQIVPDLIAALNAAVAKQPGHQAIHHVKAQATLSFLHSFNTTEAEAKIAVLPILS